jgi:nitroreductase
MDALSLLLHRRSTPKLVSPAPEGDALSLILQAGLRAPDHGGLTPWRFVVAQGNGLNTFADILVSAAEADKLDEAVIEKARHAPFRAPMVIIAISRVTSNHKVPVFEQHLSAGCAVQAMQMAAVAQGFSGFWRSGKWAYHSVVREAFGLSEEDQIVGFLYLGTPSVTMPDAHARTLSDFVEYL